MPHSQFDKAKSLEGMTTEYLGNSLVIRLFVDYEPSLIALEYSKHRNIFYSRQFLRSDTSLKESRNSPEKKKYTSINQLQKHKHFVDIIIN